MGTPARFLVTHMSKYDYKSFEYDFKIPTFLMIYNFDELLVVVYVPFGCVDKMNAISWCNQTVKLSELRGHGRNNIMLARCVIPVIINNEFIRILTDKATELAEQAYNN